MPVFLAMLGGVLIQISGSIVLRVLTSLGVSLITYTGINASLGFLKNQAVSSFSGLGADVINMLSLLQVGSCISLVFSAMLARHVLMGLTSDTVKSWVTK